MACGNLFVVKRRVKVRPAALRFYVVPLIDVTLLLIIYFMLVSNLAEDSVQMVLPKLHDPHTRKLEDVPHVTVNVVPQPFTELQRADDPLAWSGEASEIRVGATPLAASQLETLTAALRAIAARTPKDRAGQSGQSRLEVVLRADAALHYQQMQPVMSAISAAGVSKVHLVAELPDFEEGAQP